MVSRLVGLVGLSLLPWGALAGDIGVHQALEGWLADGGTGANRYRVEGTRLPAGVRPQWLFRPASSEALNARFLSRGLYPEVTTLGWRKGVGPVLIFGHARSGSGLRLVVGRGCQCPLVLETAGGVRWTLTDYRPEPDRQSPLPGRMVREGTEGSRTVLRLRP